MAKETIKQILMRRDGMSSIEADELIAEAQEQFSEYLENGEVDYAEEICMDYFGLEPDYLDEFI